MMMSIHDFHRSEDGAVTVEFLPLLAVTVFLSLAITTIVSTGLQTPNTQIAGQLNQDDIISTGGPKGNNGWGNGDQAAPGMSGPNNSAENDETARLQPGNGNGRRP